MFNEFTKFVRDLYGSKEFIPLHEPTLGLKEKNFLQTLSILLLYRVLESQ